MVQSRAYSRASSGTHLRDLASGMNESSAGVVDDSADATHGMDSLGSRFHSFRSMSQMVVGAATVAVALLLLASLLATGLRLETAASDFEANAERCLAPPAASAAATALRDLHLDALDAPTQALLRRASAAVAADVDALQFPVRLLSRLATTGSAGVGGSGVNGLTTAGLAVKNGTLLGLAGSAVVGLPRGTVLSLTLGTSPSPVSSLQTAAFLTQRQAAFESVVVVAIGPSVSSTSTACSALDTAEGWLDRCVAFVLFSPADNGQLSMINRVTGERTPSLPESVKPFEADIRAHFEFLAETANGDVSSVDPAGLTVRGAAAAAARRHTTATPFFMAAAASPVGSGPNKDNVLFRVAASTPSSSAALIAAANGDTTVPSTSGEPWRADAAVAAALSVRGTVVAITDGRVFWGNVTPFHADVDKAFAGSTRVFSRRLKDGVLPGTAVGGAGVALASLPFALPPPGAGALPFGEVTILAANVTAAEAAAAAAASQVWTVVFALSDAALAAPRQAALAAARTAATEARNDFAAVAAALCVCAAAWAVASFLLDRRFSDELAAVLAALGTNLHFVSMMQLERGTAFGTSDEAAAVSGGRHGGGSQVAGDAAPVPYSHVADILHVQLASNAMLIGLKEFRKYLPQTLLIYGEVPKDELAAELAHLIDDDDELDEEELAILRAQSRRRDSGDDGDEDGDDDGEGGYGRRREPEEGEEGEQGAVGSPRNRQEAGEDYPTAFGATFASHGTHWTTTTGTVNTAVTTNTANAEGDDPLAATAGTVFSTTDNSSFGRLDAAHLARVTGRSVFAGNFGGGLGELPGTIGSPSAPTSVPVTAQDTSHVVDNDSGHEPNHARLSAMGGTTGGGGGQLQVPNAPQSVPHSSASNGSAPFSSPKLANGFSPPPLTLPGGGHTAVPVTGRSDGPLGLHALATGPASHVPPSFDIGMDVGSMVGSIAGGGGALGGTRRRALDSGLRRVRSTIVAVSFVGFLRMSQESMQEAHAISQTFLQIVLQVIDRRGGVVLTLTPDRVTATWNAFKPEPHHEARGAQCAHDISKTLQAADEEFLLPDVQYAVAVTSGFVVAGNSGTVHERTSVVQGPCLDLAHELLTLLFGIGIRVGITQTVKEHLHSRLWTLPIDVLTDHDANRMRLYELRSGEEPPHIGAIRRGFFEFERYRYTQAEHQLMAALRVAIDPRAIRLMRLCLFFSSIKSGYIRTLPAWQRFESDLDASLASPELPTFAARRKLGGGLEGRRKSGYADEHLRNELLRMSRPKSARDDGGLPSGAPHGAAHGSPPGATAVAVAAASGTPGIGTGLLLPHATTGGSAFNGGGGGAGSHVAGAGATPTPAVTAPAMLRPTVAPMDPDIQVVVASGSGPSSPVGSPNSSPRASPKRPGALPRVSTVGMLGAQISELQRATPAMPATPAAAPSPDGPSSPVGGSSVATSTGTTAHATPAPTPTASGARSSVVAVASGPPAVEHESNGVVAFRDRRNMTFRMSDHVLGKGAFGEVLLGMTESGALVAVKSVPIPPKIDNTSQLTDIQRRRLKRKGVATGTNVESSIEEVLKEVALLSRLRHENIVGYLSSAIVDNKLLVVMEYISGGSLQSLLKEFRAVPLDTARRYLRDTLRGLNFLHNEDIVHRDIKPHNVLLLIEGSCKLTDFGTSASMSKLKGGGDAPQGTPQYMAPEAARGHGTKASDIWSFGIMTAQLITGELPWPDDGCFVPVRFMYQLSNEESMVPVLPPSISEDVAKIVSMCCQRDPSKRPTAAELIAMPFFSVTSTPFRRREREPRMREMATTSASPMSASRRGVSPLGAGGNMAPLSPASVLPPRPRGGFGTASSTDTPSFILGSPDAGQAGSMGSSSGPAVFALPSQPDGSSLVSPMSTMKSQAPMAPMRFSD